MNIGEIYSVVALVSIFQLLLVYNRSKATKYKETIDYDFCNLLLVFAAFSFVDCLWGIGDSGYSFINNKTFMIFGYLYHIMCALSSYTWFGFMVKYLKVGKREKITLSTVRGILIVTQFSLIISNIFTHCIFYIFEDMQYYLGPARKYIYINQYMYYISILLFVIYFMIKNKSVERRFRNALFFSAVGLMFCIGQYLFYDVAMYSLGYMISAFIIYAFNVAEMREQYFTEKTNALNYEAKIDSVTGLHNRRSFEEDIKKFDTFKTDSDFVYVSMDMNGLKWTNDNLGHAAGDELLQGAAECMKRCFGSYGKLFRIGGDEFAAIIFADSNKIEEIKSDFFEAVGQWQGVYSRNLSISCGFVYKNEIQGKSVHEVMKLADSRMYDDKNLFYSKRGFDRRGHDEAQRAIFDMYEKILKVNLSDDSFQILKIKDTQNDLPAFDKTSISEWLRDYGLSGNVREDDLDRYFQFTDTEDIKGKFLSGRRMIYLKYHRKIGGEFHMAVMEIMPSSDYSENCLSLFLLVKAIED